MNDAVSSDHSGEVSGERGEGFECDEVDFAICCLVLCDYSSYDMADGEIQIVAQA